MAASWQKKILFLFSIVLQHVLGQQSNTSIWPIYCDGNSTPKLKIDTGLLTITSGKTHNIVLLMQSENCYTCNLIPTAVIKKETNCSYLVDTRWPMRLEIQIWNNGTMLPADESCRDISKSFLENGQYLLWIHETNDGENIRCSNVTLNNDPIDSNIPIYVAIGIGIVLSLIWILMKFLYRKGILHRMCFFWTTEGMMVTVMSTLVFKGDHIHDLGTPTNINAGEDPNKLVVPKKERLRSLDTFRGLSLTVMNFVNYGGGGYWFFHHSKWNGITVADLVFPWFMFIMGTSMVYSFKSQVNRNTSKKRMFWKIFKRSLILFGLGLMLNTGISGGVVLTQMRIPGVLQRFGVTYLIVATIHMFFMKSASDTQYRWWSPVRDVLDYWVEWMIYLVMLAVWTGVTFGLQVPGCPTGYLGPGGLADGGNHTKCTGGAAGYIDSQILGANHLYQSPTAKELYHTSVPYDPEGILGILTSCFMCFLGLQVGKILIIYKDWVQRIKRFLIWGILLGIIGTILCKGTQNEGWIPINKNLWSLSFVVTLSSLGFFLFAICYLLIDVWGIWTGAPFYYPGLNAILVFVGHEVFMRHFPFSFHVNDSHPEKLAMSIWATFLWFCIALYLDYKQIYLTV